MSGGNRTLVRRMEGGCPETSVSDVRPSPDHRDKVLW